MILSGQLGIAAFGVPPIESGRVPNITNQPKIMKRIFPSGVVTLCGLMLAAATAMAAPQAKTYQVTGPVLEVTDTSITVKKGEDNWQIARDAGTKIKGDLKVGAKVTIQYRMIATDVEVKVDQGEAKKTEKK